MSATPETPATPPAAPPPDAPAKAEEPPQPAAAPFDPNKNVVYDLLFDVADLELVTRLKWDLFSVEQRLEKVLEPGGELAAKAPELHGELTTALALFRQDETVLAYKERFVRSEERLKLAELVKFLELAVRVREPLHAAWTRWLEWEHERLLAELAALDRDGVAKRPAALLTGVRERNSRRCTAVIVHTERSARQIFAEIPFRDYSRMIAWLEEKNPLLANLIADTRLVYLQTELVRGTSRVAKEIRVAMWATAAFAAVAAIATVVAIFR